MQQLSASTGMSLDAAVQQYTAAAAAPAEAAAAAGAGVEGML